MHLIGLHRRGSPRLWIGLILLVLLLLTLAGCAAPAADGDVPRNRTLVITPWSDRTGPLTNPENWHIYQSGNQNQRQMGSKTIFEALMYTNLNTGELIPWQAESYEYNDDFTAVTVNLRAGVEWSDGEPFTCADVKYTLEMLRDNAPELNYSFIYEEWLDNVECVDDLTVVIENDEPVAGCALI